MGVWTAVRDELDEATFEDGAEPASEGQKPWSLQRTLYRPHSVRKGTKGNLRAVCDRAWLQGFSSCVEGILKAYETLQFHDFATLDLKFGAIVSNL